MKQGSGQDVVTVATGVERWCACSGFPVLVNVFRTVLDVFGVGESRNGKTVRCVTSGRDEVLFFLRIWGAHFLAVRGRTQNRRKNAVPKYIRNKYYLNCCPKYQI